MFSFNSGGSISDGFDRFLSCHYEHGKYSKFACTLKSGVLYMFCAEKNVSHKKIFLKKISFSAYYC